MGPGGELHLPELKAAVTRLGLDAREDGPARAGEAWDFALESGLVIVEGGGPEWTFYRKRRCPDCGADAPDPDPRLFRYNSPLGACPTCEGYGSVVDLDPSRIVPDPSKTIEGGAIAPMIAVRNPAARFVVLMAGPGMRIGRLLNVQDARIARASGVPEEQIAKRSAFFNKLYADLATAASNTISIGRTSPVRLDCTGSIRSSQRDWSGYSVG